MFIMNIIGGLGLINFPVLVKTITPEIPGFHEKGSLSYLCALVNDRQSPLNECTLHEPFI